LFRDFPAKRQRSPKGFLADVDDGGHVRRGLFAGPAPRLLVELELEIVDPYRAKISARQSRDSRSGQEIALGFNAEDRLAVALALPGARHPGRMPFGAITVELIGNLAQPPSTP
jgi:hypothetical protein